jgi:putative phage-type endonuclease
MIQGSDEWKQARVGKVTASRISDVMAKLRTGGWGASRANYKAQLVAERLTGVPQEGYQSPAMKWGIEQEANAVTLYEFLREVDVTKVGFIDHPLIPMSGASPDGLVDGHGLIECKCPLTSTHIDTLLNGTVDGSYVKQMQWQMACTDAEWCDFVSYDPRLPADMQLFIKRFERDEMAIKELEAEVQYFLKDVELTVQDLLQRYRREA